MSVQLRQYPKDRVLVVEGYSDLDAIAAFVSRHLPWDRESPPIHIRHETPRSDLLQKKEVISSYLKQSGLQRIGFVLDANGSCEEVRKKLASKLIHFGITVPSKISPNGFISRSNSGVHVGVWIMPNNNDAGYLEHFLQSMVAPQMASCLKSAEAATKQAVSDGATYKSIHTQKAVLHTFAAWQDEPGQRFGVCFVRGYFDASLSAGQPFLAWIRTLFDL